MNEINYISATKNSRIAVRRTLGVHLFMCRQSRKLTLERVSKDTGLSSDKIDRIEIGKCDVYMRDIIVLMGFYKRKFNLSQVSELIKNI